MIRKEQLKIFYIRKAEAHWVIYLQLIIGFLQVRGGARDKVILKNNLKIRTPKERLRSSAPATLKMKIVIKLKLILI